MKFPGISIGFISFLRDCQKENLASYLRQLTDLIAKYHQHPWHRHCLQTEDFFDLNQKVIKKYEVILCEVSVNWFRFYYWEFSKLHCEFKRNEMYLREGDFSITIYLNHFPNIIGLLGIRYFGDLNEINYQSFSNKYKQFVIEGLQTGLFDLIYYDTKRLGKRKWLYFYHKIWKIKSLQPFHSKITRYDQINKPFRLVEEDLSSIHFMEQLTELSFEKKEVKKFLKQHDQLLLLLWGSKEFADKLKPLGVSLKEWLKAV
jgi:hypothetical protein